MKIKFNTKEFENINKSNSQIVIQNTKDSEVEMKLTHLQGNKKIKIIRNSAKLGKSIGRRRLAGVHLQKVGLKFHKIIIICDEKTELITSQLPDLVKGGEKL